MLSLVGREQLWDEGKAMTPCAGGVLAGDPTVLCGENWNFQGALGGSVGH